MNKKQQTNKSLKTTDVTKSFENELNSFIKKAKESGCTKTQAITYLKNYWRENDRLSINFPEENENEKKFHKKVNTFFNSKYDEFNDFALPRTFSYSLNYRALLDELPVETKKKFICEVACSIYKASEIGVFIRKTLKQITIKRTMFLFPDVIKHHPRYFDTILSALLSYADKYESKECERFLEQFTFEDKYEYDVCKFIWLVENFQP